jgi:hypothetical protein
MKSGPRDRGVTCNSGQWPVGSMTGSRMSMA